MRYLCCLRSTLLALVSAETKTKTKTNKRCCLLYCCRFSFARCVAPPSSLLPSAGLLACASFILLSVEYYLPSLTVSLPSCLSLFLSRRSHGGGREHGVNMTGTQPPATLPPLGYCSPASSSFRACAAVSGSWPSKGSG